MNFQIKSRNNPQILPEPNFRLIGHRGVPSLAPENTLASFALAAEFRLNWVEFDTVQLKTGEWIVIHDDTLERTTNGSGFVIDTPFETLRMLDAGSWFNSSYKTERIPLLSEVLELLDNLNIHPNIEIKSMNFSNDFSGNVRENFSNGINTRPSYRHSSKLTNLNNLRHSTKSFLSVIDGYWPQSKPLPLVSSFDLSYLVALKELNSNLPIGYLIENYVDESLAVTLQYDFQSLHCDYQNIHPTDIKKIIDTQKRVLLYTVDDQDDYKKFISQGVYALFTNNPGICKDL